MARHLRVSIVNSLPPASPRLPEMGAEVMSRFWQQKLSQVLPDGPGLIVLPEFCDLFRDCSPDYNLEYYHTRGEQMLRCFQDTARAGNCYIAYPSLQECENGTRWNSIRIVNRSGDVIGIYAKNHPTIDETSDYGVDYGTSAPVIECDFGTLGCAICFDLNFDELRLQYAASRPDLILFSSMYHGGLLQACWAYSCRAFFVASVGGLPSAVLSPVGQEVATTTNYFDFVTTTINLDSCVVHLDYNWQRLRDLKAKYGAGVTISDPGFLGSVLVSSELDGIRVLEMIQDFEIELLDEYFTRAREHRRTKLSHRSE